MPQTIYIESAREKGNLTCVTDKVQSHWLLCVRVNLWEKERERGNASSCEGVNTKEKRLSLSPLALRYYSSTASTFLPGRSCECSGFSSHKTRVIWRALLLPFHRKRSSFKKPRFPVFTLQEEKRRATKDFVMKGIKKIEERDSDCQDYLLVRPYRLCWARPTQWIRKTTDSNRGLDLRRKWKCNLIIQLWLSFRAQALCRFRLPRARGGTYTHPEWSPRGEMKWRQSVTVVSRYLWFRLDPSLSVSVALGLVLTFGGRWLK